MSTISKGDRVVVLGAMSVVREVIDDVVYFADGGYADVALVERVDAVPDPSNPLSGLINAFDAERQSIERSR